MNLVSICIPTRNRHDLVRKCLSLIEAQVCGLKNIEVLVSDDSDGNETCELLSNHFHQFRYQRGPRCGRSANRNASLRAASGDWIIFIDDDCLPGESWLAAYLEAIMRVGMGEAVFFWGEVKPDRPQERFDEEAPDTRLGGAMLGANFAVFRMNALRLGGFDEDFLGWGYEDNDFKQRAIKEGIQIREVLEGKIIHPWRPARSVAQLPGSIGNLKLYLRKHPDQYHQFFSMPKRFRRNIGKTRKFTVDIFRFQGRGWFFGALSLLSEWFEFFYIPIWFHLKRNS